MPLDRNTVERRSAQQIAELQKARELTDAEKRDIRRMHEDIARKVAIKSRR